MASNFGNDPFGNMDDLFNNFFGQMGNGQDNQQNARYIVNGHELTPQEVQQLRQSGQLPSGPQQPRRQSPQQPGQGIPMQQAGAQKQEKKSDRILDQIGRNLTQEAKDGLLDPVIGRDKEIQETAEILSRRIKNNPVLVGDAGVGKTAVVEGLAQHIVKGDVPASIKDKQIVSVDLSALEAGTQYRGSYEEKIQKLVKEVEQAKNVIVFFDEIHQIVGAGATGDETGSKGLADMLKPALSRGEISIIGATTQDEFRNSIMKDHALARRFNPVTVNQPDNKVTFEILQGIKKAYEDHHQVKLPDDVLKAAVDYSNQYIPQSPQPDKAIDMIDMTAAHLAAENPVADKVTIEKQLTEAQNKKNQAARNEDYKGADEAQKEISKLQEQLKAADASIKDKEPVATPQDVAETVARSTGIPVGQLSTSEVDRLKGMDSRLKGRVIGQDQAVDQVVDAIRRNRAGFDEGNRPIGSFLFVGPTGVGKTELVKQLSEDMFNDQDAIIRLDMSEYEDLTAVSKLIGASAGYVGYNDNGNTLTEQVRRRPYSIILLDEIEKANPQVLNLLLQVMDDGRLTDAQGNVINFKNTVIIATSNAGFGNDKLTDNKKKDMKILDRLAPYFRPEFLNRFNAVVEFAHLNKQNLSAIVDLLIQNLDDDLARKNITLTLKPGVKEYLMDQGYDEAMGARPLRRVVEQQLRNRIAQFYLDHQGVKHLLAEMNNTVKPPEVRVVEDKNYKEPANKSKVSK